MRAFKIYSPAALLMFDLADAASLSLVHGTGGHRRRPGQFIGDLSAERRAVLRELTSDDLREVRFKELVEGTEYRPLSPAHW